MPKVINKATFIPLTQVSIKLNQSIETMNADGWELMNAAVESIGIEEFFILFWRKEIDPSPFIISATVSTSSSDGNPL